MKEALMRLESIRDVSDAIGAIAECARKAGFEGDGEGIELFVCRSAYYGIEMLARKLTLMICDEQRKIKEKEEAGK